MGYMFSLNIGYRTAKLAVLQADTTTCVMPVEASGTLDCFWLEYKDQARYCCSKDL